MTEWKRSRFSGEKVKTNWYFCPCEGCDFKVEYVVAWKEGGSSTLRLSRLRSGVEVANIIKAHKQLHEHVRSQLAKEGSKTWFLCALGQL